jgi:hypothetical protein
MRSALLSACFTRQIKYLILCFTGLHCAPTMKLHQQRSWPTKPIGENTMARKARTTTQEAPKATYTIVAPATLPSAPLTAFGKALPAPATPVAAPQQNATSYALGGSWQAVVAKAGLQTRQRVTKGTTDWQQHATLKPNTRAVVLSTASQALGATFTYEQWAAALAPLAKDGTLGSGSPRSYFVAFVKCGYIVAQ